MPPVNMGLKQIQLWVLGAQLLVLVAGFGVWTWFDLARIEEDSAEEIEAASMLLEEHVLRSLAAIDGALLQTADLVHELGLAGLRSEAAWRRLRSIARPLPLSGAIFIYDLSGDALASSSSFPAPPSNAADREFFREVVAGGSEHYIGRALQGRSVHTLFFPNAIPIKSTEGRVQAVAQVGVEVDYIADLFTKAELSGKTFGLYRLSDGAVVARHPVTERLLDESIASQPFFHALAEGSPLWTGWVEAGGNRQLVSARRVSDLPLILTASMPHRGVFGKAHEQLLWRGMAFLIAVAALLMLGGMLLMGAGREARLQDQQRRAETELRDREEQLRLFVEHAPAAIAMFDPEMRYLAVSRRWLSDYRLEGHSVLGRSHYEIFPDMPERWQAVHRRCLAGAVERAEEDRFERGDGKVQWLRWEVRPWHSANGRVGGIMTFTEDITESKRAEEALRRQGAELAEAQRVAHVGSWFWDAQTDVTTGSDELLRIYGFDPATQSMPNFREQRGRCYPVADWERLNEAVQTSMATGVGYELDIRAFRNGALIWISTRSEVVRGEDGRIVALRGTVQDISRRVAAQEALRQSEERYRRLVQTASEGIWQVDTGLHTVDVNERMARMLGYSREEVIGRGIHEFMAPEEVADVRKRSVGRRQGVAESYESRLVRKDGSTMDVLVSAAPLRDERGNVIGSFGMFTDITERKRAEAALRESERRYRELVQSANSAIIRWSSEGTITFFNDYAQSFFGWSAGDVIGKPVGILVPERESTGVDLPRLVQEVLDHPKRHESSVNENVCRDGRRVWMTWTNRAMLDERGKVTEILAIGNDITDRVRMEKDLRSAKERTQAILESITDGFLSMDKTWLITYFNETGARMLGMEREDLEGHNIWEIFPLATNTKFYSEYHRAAATNTPAHFEEYYPEPINQWIECHAYPSLEGLSVFFRDIGERKRAEEQLRRLNENLEGAVRERTAELFAANRELEERAQQLRLLAGELTMTEQRERKHLSKILHDGLQQYLVAAKLQVGGLVQQMSDEEARQTALSVEGLLGESILVSRSLAAELSPPILYEAGILAGMEWLARWMANKHGLHVDLVVEMEPPALSEDVKVLLFESVRELLLNVVKHAKAKSARVHLSRDGGNLLRITVSDRGQGFNAARAPHGRDGGGGFGLFSIRERIGLVGGRFEMESSPGKGSRFALIAPYEPGEPVEAGLDGSGMVTRGPEAAGRAPGKIRILLTDDHAVMREGLARLLAQEPDFEVVGQANDGRQAIEKAAALLPDVVLMDISMPVMNGIDATRIIRRQHPHMAIIGLSLYSEEEQGSAMREAGATLYMTKSGPPASLKETIRACMRTRSRDETEPAGDTGTPT